VDDLTMPARQPFRPHSQVILTIDPLKHGVGMIRGVNNSRLYKVEWEDGAHGAYWARELEHLAAWWAGDVTSLTDRDWAALTTTTATP
jgi:hypothetical protein